MPLRETCMEALICMTVLHRLRPELGEAGVPREAILAVSGQRSAKARCWKLVTVEVACIVHRVSLRIENAGQCVDVTAENRC